MNAKLDAKPAVGAVVLRADAEKAAVIIDQMPPGQVEPGLELTELAEKFLRLLPWMAASGPDWVSRPQARLSLEELRWSPSTK